MSWLAARKRTGAFHQSGHSFIEIDLKKTTHLRRIVRMILVTGASGYIGRAATHHLAASGKIVATMMRNPQKGEATLPAGVAVRVADYENPESLRRAFEGVTDLLFIASDGIREDVTRHHTNVISAATTSCIERICFTSITDIGATSLFYFTSAYREAEQLLLKSGKSCVVLRCGLYVDFILTH